MSNRTIKKVVVQELTKWGYKDASGYVNFSKTLSENDRAAVVPGAEFDAEIYLSDPTDKYPNGTRYLNKIVAQTAKVKVNKPAASVSDFNPPVDTARAKKFTPKFEKKTDALTSAGLSKDEWAAKDRRISRQGCIQVAVQVQADWDQAVELANKMLEFVNQ
jgi:hypothetical protein